MPTCSSTPARPASSSAESPPRRIRNPLRPRRSTAPRPRLNPRRPLGSQRRSANGGKHGRPARRCSSSGPTMSSYAGKRSSRVTSTAARWRERGAHRSPFDRDRVDEAVKSISDRAPGHSYRRARARRAAASLRSRHLAQVSERLWQAPAESSDHRRRGRWQCATRRCSSPWPEERDRSRRSRSSRRGLDSRGNPSARTARTVTKVSRDSRATEQVRPVSPGLAYATRPSIVPFPSWF